METITVSPSLCFKTICSIYNTISNDLNYAQVLIILSNVLKFNLKEYALKIEDENLEKAVKMLNSVINITCIEEISQIFCFRIIDILQNAISEKIDTIKTENLYSFNGKEAYSLGQGQ